MVFLRHSWGTTTAERQLAFPCDGLITGADDSVFRGVTIHASPATVFRWLCQMRVAPYSYDWIDNGGQLSPQQLIPGLENLEVGQEVMRIFALVDFERDRNLTIRLKSGTRASRTFGDLAVSYLIVPGKTDSCRLLVKLIGLYPPGAKGRFMRAFLPWGDLIMMRRQLLNLKKLAESTTREGQ